jgi:hypothetical protein
MKKITLLMTITALLMPISVQAQESNVSSIPATTSRRETPEGKRLFALLKAADEEDLSLIPQNALMRGDLRFAGDFGDLISDDFFSQAKKNLQLQLSRLSTIKRAQLNTLRNMRCASIRRAILFLISKCQLITSLGNTWPLRNYLQAMVLPSIKQRQIMKQVLAELTAL